MSAARATRSRQPRIAIVLGSASDLGYLDGVEALLARFGIRHRVLVASAHRQPAKVADFARGAAAEGVEVIVACAGYAAHLPGVIASLTTLPVIGVPLDSSPLRGADSLLAIVQMPGGVPVAAVTIGKAGVKNAAVLAAEILALKYPAVKRALVAYREEMAAG
jgi:5-(carboxyamino)imidazole ribonucleotide mutase